MKRTVLVFGLISGLVSSVLMLVNVLFVNRIGFDRAVIVGYTAIVAGFLMVFFGVRSYREQSGGRLTFGRGFTVGILITIVSCVLYVVIWQFVYYNWTPGFIDQYAAHEIEKARSSGATEQALASMRKEMADFKVMYDKPLYNAAFTFIEPFPVGLAVTVISAAVLRRK